ncbi:hypothetical protein AB2713_19760 [Citrobacter werkmanii]|uniref:hypothetical protein n=1 Tax=Citrobacter werkmanii TaxID=67827 RepID=UPI00346422D9
MKKETEALNPRPWLPHEHPGWKDYTRLFVQKLKYDALLRKPFVRYEGSLSDLFSESHLSFEEKFSRMAEYFIDSFFITPAFSTVGHIYPGGPVNRGGNRTLLKPLPVLCR